MPEARAFESLFELGDFSTVSQANECYMQYLFEMEKVVWPIDERYYEDDVGWEPQLPDARSSVCPTCVSYQMECEEEQWYLLHRVELLLFNVLAFARELFLATNG